MRAAGHGPERNNGMLVVFLKFVFDSSHSELRPTHRSYI